MKSGTKDLLIFGALGVAALYFLPNILKSGGQAAGDMASGAAGGAITAGLDYLNPFNLLSGLASNLGGALPRIAMPSVSPTTAPFAAVPQAFSALSVLGASTASKTPAPSTPSTHYYGPTIYSGGVAYAPKPASAVAYTSRVLQGQVSPQQQVAYGLGLSPSQINPNVNLNPTISNMRMAPGKTLADYQKPNPYTGR